MPVLEVDGKVMVESNAIARFIANATGTCTCNCQYNNFINVNHNFLYAVDSDALFPVHLSVQESAHLSHV